MRATNESTRAAAARNTRNTGAGVHRICAACVSEPIRTAATLLSYRAAVERQRQVSERLGSREDGPHIIVDGDWAPIKAALDEYGEHLLTFEGVEGIAIGWRRWHGRRIPQRALIVFVNRKLPDEKVRDARLPKTVTAGSRQVRIDVVQTGSFRRHSVQGGR